MSNEWSGTYLVLGASGGIGSTLSRALVARGAKVVLAAPASARLEALRAELGMPAVELDARRRAEVSEAVGVAKADGDLRGVANCVGSILLKPAHRTSEQDYDDVLQLNLTTAFNAVAAAAPALRGGGSIVLFSSAAASSGMPNHEAIAAAKAGVEGLTRAAASSYARTGVRVNAIAPGLVDTPLAASITGNEAAAEASRAMHALGRLGQPEDVAAAALWLLGPESSWVTGQVYGVDGGLAHVRPPARLGR
jgi:NAD(P)-dependent dehydrogenase (short-subunit alcohol dehydrogenase family)